MTTVEWSEPPDGCGAGSCEGSEVPVARSVRSEKSRSQRQKGAVLSAVSDTGGVYADRRTASVFVCWRYSGTATGARVCMRVGVYGLIGKALEPVELTPAVGYFWRRRHLWGSLLLYFA